MWFKIETQEILQEHALATEPRESSESVMVITDKQKHRRNDEKLPLATAVHYNWFLGLVFAIIVGQLSFHKANSFYFCNTLQKSLLIPTYSIWVVAEIPRLYAGQKGILCDKVRSKCSWFVLLSLLLLTLLSPLAFRPRNLSAIDLFPSNLDRLLSWISARNYPAHRFDSLQSNVRSDNDWDSTGVEVHEENNDTTDC